ncbi:MAG TPA: hypothetical protein VNP98_01780 [Chthoniobacterales bacterium]|nr:hypothetical protein [Chthoniobacterales bacterium]
MSIKNSALFAVILCSVAAQHLASAQVASPAPAPLPVPQDALSTINFDRAPGAVPAFDALGLSPENVSSPSTPRDFAGDLINGVDRNGVLQNGLAIETAPFRWFWIGTSIGEYRTNPFARWAYNFSVSVATAKAVEKSDAVQLAIGFKEVLWESADHDPYRNSDLDKAARAGSRPFSDDLDSGPLPESVSDPNPWAAAVEEFYKNKWRGGIWTAAIAPTWNSESGELSDLTETGFTVWTAFAYGLPKNWSPRIGSKNPLNVQFAAELRYRNGEHVTDPNDKMHIASQNSFLTAARVRVGSDTFNGFAEGGYVRVWHGLNGDDDGWRGALGVEKRIAPNVWLVLSAGQQFGGGSVEGNELFVLSSLRFGTADKAQFAK